MRRSPLAVALLVLGAASAQAGVDVREEVGTDPRSLDPHVLLEPGTAGTATLGQSGTSASVVMDVRIQSRSFLEAAVQEGTWAMSVRLVATSGLQSNDDVTISIEDASGSAIQVEIVDSVVLVASGAPLTAAAGEGITLLASGNLPGTGARSLELELVQVPAGSGMAVHYAVDLSDDTGQGGGPGSGGPPGGGFSSSGEG